MRWWWPSWRAQAALERLLAEKPTPRLTQDDKLIDAFLTKGRGPVMTDNLVYRQGNGDVLVRGAGYKLLFRSREAIYLNLAEPADLSWSETYRYRKMALESSERTGVPVIPISQVSLARAGIRESELVERIDLEAVLQTGGRYYLSGYDSQENPPLYFLCRLPRPVKTIAEARESLKPDSVLRAEAAGVQVGRQGDLFVIRSTLTTGNLTTMEARFLPRTPLYGTAHTADRIAQLPNGVMLASGTMVHDPYMILGERRPPDHSPLGLGDSWWWVARNTVPVQQGPGVPPDAIRHAEPARPWVRFGF